MKQRRSASQILFGFLKEQTADLEGRIWKVKDWRYPLSISDVDSESLRDELKKHVYPWHLSAMDGGYYAHLQAGTPIKVLGLDRKNGVSVEIFPKTWRCKHCNRFHRQAYGKCSCGVSSRYAQLPFVAFHDQCGTLRPPMYPMCPEHKAISVILPQSSKTSEIRFECPVCRKQIRKGFRTTNCECGNGSLQINIHRASSVYAPKSLVLVNPPSKQKIAKIKEAGGSKRALNWVVSGMNEATIESSRNTTSSLEEDLRSKGISEEHIAKMLNALGDESEMEKDEVRLNLTPNQLREAEYQSIKIAMATLESRLSAKDLADTVDESSQLHTLYEDEYPQAFRESGIFSIDFISEFPILNASYGYTRGDHSPGAARLVPFKDVGSGQYAVYGDVAQTEALFFRLNPISVINWLIAKGYSLQPAEDLVQARKIILENATFPDLSLGEAGCPIGQDVMQLVHTYCHRLLRITSVYSGIDRNALSELLTPCHLGFFIYATPRGEFVLGGLQSLFESELDKLLKQMIRADLRCPLDPGCSKAGGACMACLHIGEPSCRHYNQYLSRSVLKGELGYFNFARLK